MPHVGNVLTDPQCAARLGVPEALLMALQQHQQQSGAQPPNEAPAQPIQQVLDDTASFLRSVAFGPRPGFQRRLATGLAVPAAAGSQLLLDRHSRLSGQQQQQPQHQRLTHEQLAACPEQQNSNTDSLIAYNGTSSGTSAGCSGSGSSSGGSGGSGGSMSVQSPPSSAGPSPKLPAAAATTSSCGRQLSCVAPILAPQPAAAALLASCSPGAAVSCSTAAASNKAGVAGAAGSAPGAATPDSNAAAVPAVAPASAVLDPASPVECASAAPAPAVPATAPAAGAAAAAAATILTAEPAVHHPNHKWAVVHTRELLDEWRRQQQQQAGVPVLALAEAAGLRRHLAAYAWLNQELRGLRVYCEITAKDGRPPARFSSSISCLDPRTAAHITHSTHSSSSLPGEASRTTSCERYLADKYGVQLQLPGCPCLVVELSADAQQRCSSAGGSSSSSSSQVAQYSSTSQEAYRTYPLEFCWLEQTSPQHNSQLKRRDPRHIWDPIPITPDPAGLTTCTAPWIAAALIKEQQGVSIAAQQTAAAAVPPFSTKLSLQTGLKSLIAALLPPEKEDRWMHRVGEAVSNAINSSQQCGAWTVARAKSVGSFEKRTNLGGTSDLDIIIVLKCNTPSQYPFEACRMQLLGQVQQQLCQPLHVQPDAEGAAVGAEDQLKAHAARGWQLLDCVPCYYLTLRHPLLHMQLDVQVAQYHGETQEQQWQGVMQPVQEKAGAAAPAGQLPAVMPARQRTTDLTELSVVVVRGVERLYKEQRGQPSGYGRLATDVIRLCKAFGRYGLPAALGARAAQSASLQSSSSSSSSSSAAAAAEGGGEAGVAPAASCSSSSVSAVHSAAAPFKGPPAYMWEILVLYVLQQHAAADKFYRQNEPLSLFKAVLQEASKLLRTGDAGEALQRAVILDMSRVFPGGFTVEETKKFRDSWGRGHVHTPYIINPVDPTFNCTIMQPFRAWDAVADAARELHEQLVQASGGAGCDGGGAAAGGDAWQHLLSSSTLGPVWNACHPRD